MQPWVCVLGIGTPSLPNGILHPLFSQRPFCTNQSVGDIVQSYRFCVAVIVNRCWGIGSESLDWMKQLCSHKDGL